MGVIKWFMSTTWEYGLRHPGLNNYVWGPVSLKEARARFDWYDTDAELVSRKSPGSPWETTGEGQ